MRIIICLISLILSAPVMALEDSLLKAIEIAHQGNFVQGERLKIVAENIANEFTTGAAPGSDPYRRKIIIAENKYHPRAKTHLLRVKKYDVDKSNFGMRFDPSHPAADDNGYVKIPNVINEIEKTDASEARRAYEANLAVIEMSREMMKHTLEMIK